MGCKPYLLSDVRRSDGLLMFEILPEDVIALEALLAKQNQEQRAARWSVVVMEFDEASQQMRSRIQKIELMRAATGYHSLSLN